NEMRVGDQVANALNSEAKQVDRASNQDEKALDNGADPTRVEDRSNAQANLADQIGQLIQEKGTAKLAQDQNLEEQLVPRGVDGGVGTNTGTVTIGKFTYGDGSFREPTPAGGQFSTTAHLKDTQLTSSSFDGKLLLDNTPDQNG